MLELLNKVSRLSLVLLVGCSGGAYELLFKVWFWRGYRAFDLAWSASVVLHDRGWCVTVTNNLNFFCLQVSV